MPDDWLFDEGRRVAAAEHLYQVATDLIARQGGDALSVDKLAAMAHCSRATVYRYVGGKKDIREAVLTRSATRIVDSVRQAVRGLSGDRRVITAIEVAVAQIRDDPAGRLFLESAQHGSTWITESAAVTAFATELAGVASDDAQCARWIARVVLSLLFWPEPDSEHILLTRFVAPAFAGSE
jgi:AcrR family transcriptional regulator